MKKTIVTIVAIAILTTVYVFLTNQDNPDRMRYLSYLSQFNKPVPNDSELFYRTQIFLQNIR